MRLVNAYPGTVVSYSGHFANRGWLDYASDSTTNNNPIIGNANDRFRLEALRVGVGNAIAAGARPFGLSLLRPPT
jgi:hypothetical protein